MKDPSIIIVTFNSTYFTTAVSFETISSFCALLSFPVHFTVPAHRIAREVIILDFGITGVAAITALCFLLGQAIKAHRKAVQMDSGALRTGGMSIGACRLAGHPRLILPLIPLPPQP